MIPALIVLGYVLMGIGTARWTFTRQYARVYPTKEAIYEQAFGKARVHRETMDESDVSVYPWFAGGFWPLALLAAGAWIGLIRPVGTVVWPMAVQWFTAPARRRVGAS